VVFGSEIDLRGHQAEEHSGKSTRGVQLDLQLNYAREEPGPSGSSRPKGRGVVRSQLTQPERTITPPARSTPERTITPPAVDFFPSLGGGAPSRPVAPYRPANNYPSLQQSSSSQHSSNGGHQSSTVGGNYVKKDKGKRKMKAPPLGFGSQLVSLADPVPVSRVDTANIVEPVARERKGSAQLSDATASGLASLLGSSVENLTEFKSLAAAFQGGFITAVEFIESFARLVLRGGSDIYGFERNVVEEMGRFWKGLAVSIPGKAKGSVKEEEMLRAWNDFKVKVCLRDLMILANLLFCRFT
jgi:hypothetical protein